MTQADPSYPSTWFGEDVAGCFLGLPVEVASSSWPHPLNTPGPMYVTTDNLVSLAGMQRDGGRMVGTDGQFEYFWRQPRDTSELRAALEAANEDEVASYCWDGLAHWEPLAISLWWAGRARLIAYLHSVLTTTSHTDGLGVRHDVIRNHLAYFDADMELDLRQLAYFLEHRKRARSGVPLPLL